MGHETVADDNEVPEVTLVQTIKNFSKRPIEQLDIIKEIDVLVSLSGRFLGGDGKVYRCSMTDRFCARWIGELA